MDTSLGREEDTLEILSWTQRALEFPVRYTVRANEKTVSATDLIDVVNRFYADSNIETQSPYTVPAGSLILTKRMVAREIVE